MHGLLSSNGVISYLENRAYEIFQDALDAEVITPADIRSFQQEVGKWRTAGVFSRKSGKHTGLYEKLAIGIAQRSDIMGISADALWTKEKYQAAKDEVVTEVFGSPAQAVNQAHGMSDWSDLVPILDELLPILRESPFDKNELLYNLLHNHGRKSNVLQRMSDHFVRKYIPATIAKRAEDYTLLLRELIVQSPGFQSKHVAGA